MKTRLTKIIATLGPASASKPKVKALVQAGVNLFRLNLSHGKHEDFKRWIVWIRETEKELKTFVGILLDLQGPKIRVGKFENGFIALHRGDRMTFTTEKVMGKKGLAHVQYRDFHKAVEAGNRVYLDDGNICVRVLKIDGRRVQVEVETGGNLSNFKGLNLPDAKVSPRALTAKDKKDLLFGLEQGVDYVALSFASSAKDIVQLRRLIQKAEGDAEIIAKIERKQAVDNLESIMEAADAVMVARGDLGIEIPMEDVPAVQQTILKLSARLTTPVIVATQMLESMIENPRPTRAEISDIAQAVTGCADAVMLSGETAVGRHPVEAVKVMARTALRMEDCQREDHRILSWRRFFDKDPTIGQGITYSADRMAELLNARALMIFTLSGGTARQVAAPLPMVPVFAFTSSRRRAGKLTLIRGCRPFMVRDSQYFLEDLKKIFAALKSRKLLKKGDRVVLTAGIPAGIPQWTNVIRVEETP